MNEKRKSRAYELFTHDWDTNNKSFIRMAEELYYDFVTRYEFPLRLIDSSLKGVDPRSDSLTDKEKLSIMNECRSNPWYFMREVVRIPTVEGGERRFIPLEINRGTLASLYLLLNGVDNHITTPGQISMGTRTIAAGLLCIWFNPTKIEQNIISKRPSFIRDIMVDMYDDLPEYFKVYGDDPLRKGGRSIGLVEGMDTESFVGSRTLMEKRGRSLVNSIQFYDSIESIENVDALILSSGVPVSGPRYRVFTSTITEDLVEFIEGHFLWEVNMYDIPAPYLADYVKVKSKTGIVHVK